MGNKIVVAVVVFTLEVLHSIPNINTSPITSIALINVNNEGIISKLLNNLNPSEASVPDQLPICLLKYASKELTLVLRKICQQSLNT